MKQAALILALAIQAANEAGPWRLVYYTASKDRKSVQPKSVLSDGTDPRPAELVPSKGGLSPDGKRKLDVRMWEGKCRIWLTDVDGSNEKPLTDDQHWDNYPAWTPDGKRIVFASNRSGTSQIWVMESDGSNPVKLTQHPDGATEPQVSTMGRIAYVEKHAAPREKLPPSTLRAVDVDGANSKVVVERTQMLEHAWSPKGDQLAVSLVNELRILDPSSGKPVMSFKFAEIHKDLYAHAANALTWRPDGKAIACTIQFLGGRKEGTEIFGDKQVFILPFEGKSAVIEADGHSWPVRWNTDKK